MLFFEDYKKDYPEVVHHDDTHHSQVAEDAIAVDDGYRQGELNQVSGDENNFYADIETPQGRVIAALIFRAVFQGKEDQHDCEGDEEAHLRCCYRQQDHSPLLCDKF